MKRLEIKSKPKVQTMFKQKDGAIGYEQESFLRNRAVDALKKVKQIEAEMKKKVENGEYYVVHYTERDGTTTLAYRPVGKKFEPMFGNLNDLIDFTIDKSI